MTVETAEDILNRHLRYGKDTYLGGSEESILSAMREIADKAWEASYWTLANEYRRSEGWPLVPGNYPDKESFMKQLFPEKEV